MKFRATIFLLFYFSNAILFGQLGCTDPLAANYSSAASQNDGSCIYNAATIAPISSFNLPSETTESSGLLIIDGHVVTHNDDADTNLYVIDLISEELANILPIPFVSNIDWEDLSQDETYIYIGDFGNNVSGNRMDLRIYRVEKTSLATNPIIDTISFFYDIQTDFTPQNSNNTDFDCEAFIVRNGQVYLFTKEYVSKNTSLFTFSATPGVHQAMFNGTLNVNGLITGATHVTDKQLVILTGYSIAMQPFIYLLYDFHNDDFFEGNKRKITLPSLIYHQVEGITTQDGLTYYLSNEQFQLGTISNVAQLHVLDLSTFLFDFLNPPSATIPQVNQNWKVVVYPNPTSDQLVISTSNSNFSHDLLLRIVDVNGKEVFSSPMTTNEFSINVKEYFLGVGYYSLFVFDPLNRVQISVPILIN